MWTGKTYPVLWTLQTLVIVERSAYFLNFSVMYPLDDFGVGFSFVLCSVGKCSLGRGEGDSEGTHDLTCSSVIMYTHSRAVFSRLRSLTYGRPLPLSPLLHRLTKTEILCVRERRSCGRSCVAPADRGS